MNHVVRDKTGRPIHEGDVIKLFHFFGARRKKHFMYKHVTVKNERLYALHLGRLQPGEPKGFFIDKHYVNDHGVWEDCEIVQSSEGGYSK